jgi:hypothetical protein
MHVLVILLRQLLGLLKAARQVAQPEVAQSEPPHSRRAAPPSSERPPCGPLCSAPRGGRLTRFLTPLREKASHWQRVAPRRRSFVCVGQRYSAQQRGMTHPPAAGSPSPPLAGVSVER